MSYSSMGTNTSISTMFPVPESRILIYEKDQTNLKPLKIYYDDSGKKWVEARPNTKFVIEIKNNCGNNALAIVSVDGLNVIDGKRAELKNERGYIIDRYSSTKISGWRTSLDEVREFVFTDDKSESFSHKLGADQSNVGVIGIALFQEKTPSWVITYPYHQPWYIPIPTYPYWSSTTSSGTVTNASSTDQSQFRNCTTNTSSDVFKGSSTTSCCVNSEQLSSTACDYSLSMSTKQGSTVTDKVCESSREFDNTVSWTDIIYYDSYENLVKNGIIKKTKSMPQPFANDGFCPSL